MIFRSKSAEGQGIYDRRASTVPPRYEVRIVNVIGFHDVVQYLNAYRVIVCPEILPFPFDFQLHGPRRQRNVAQVLADARVDSALLRRHLLRKHKRK